MLNHHDVIVDNTIMDNMSIQKKDLNILVTNEATGWAKNVRLPERCFDASMHQSIYDKMAVEWPTELQTKLDGHQCQVMCSVRIRNKI
jgi:hypothetical protein